MKSLVAFPETVPFHVNGICYNFEVMSLDLQGWLKCEDTACGARVQKLPLMFQRGHPVCPSCQRGVLHPEVGNTTKILYIRTDRSEQTVQTQIRLFLKEQSD